ncbi:Hpt domain-containing protein [Candidatus Roizmanbacteria bacterium]|nr:Hpt domain-containing protein [Candidatus Roizmanbacteria bacterium]
MDPLDLNSYKALFLKSSSGFLKEIKDNLSSNGNNKDLHRLFHNLKGQALFMNLGDTGQLCLTAEKIMEDFINGEIPLDATTKNQLSEIIVKIELSLKKYESINS